VTVPEDERKFSGIDWDLIKDVRMIAVQRLPCGIGTGRVVRTLLDGIERAGSGNDWPSDSKAALRLDHQRLRLAFVGFLRPCWVKVMAAVNDSRKSDLRWLLLIDFAPSYFAGRVSPCASSQK